MIINGRKISEKILSQLKEKIKKEQLKLKLAVVLVGEDKQSKIYIKKKKEAAQRIRVEFELFELPVDILQEDLENKIKSIKDANGIVVQLPLPDHIDADRVLSLIPKEKDVEANSPVVCAIEHILKEYNISLRGKKIALLGKGRLIGIPVTEWLKREELEFSENIKEADIIISGIGKRNFITPNIVKEGVIIIDFGGDASPEVEKKAKFFTPRIGGAGPITVACLFENLVVPRVGVEPTSPMDIRV